MMEIFGYKGKDRNEGFVSHLWEIGKHVLWIWVERESCQQRFMVFSEFEDTLCLLG